MSAPLFCSVCFLRRLIFFSRLETNRVAFAAFLRRGSIRPTADYVTSTLRSLPSLWPGPLFHKCGIISSAQIFALIVAILRANLGLTGVISTRS